MLDDELTDEEIQSHISESQFTYPAVLTAIAAAQRRKSLWWVVSVLSDEFISTDDPNDPVEVFCGDLSQWLELAGIEPWEAPDAQ